ncbi:MAG: PDZ domain-containing protein [Pseudomonadota bacterium]
MKTITKIALLFLVALGCIRPAIAEDIKLTKIGDMYNVPMRINDARTMNFLLDTGAVDVGFTDDVVDGLLKAGVLQEGDFKGSETFKMVDGSSIKCRKINLRKVHIGNREVKDVAASSCPGKDSLVVGQSLLKKLELLTIDYGRQALVVKGGGEVVAETPTYTKKDIAYYEEAGSQKDAVALYNLALAYYQGSGVPKDMKKAVELLQRAADLNYSMAQAYLGMMYANGEGVPQDYAKAVEWYRKSAEQGNAFGQASLGVMYAKGHGVPQDYAKAMELFRKSADQGNADGQSNLGVLYAKGDGVPQDYAKAAELFKKSAEQGNAGGQYRLGWMYAEGHGVPQNYAKAAELYRKSAEQGNSEGQYGLRVLYAEGHGGPKNLAKAASSNVQAKNQWRPLFSTAPSEEEIVNKKGEVIIRQVTPSFPAAKAGIRAGDVLVSIGEKPVDSIMGAISLLDGDAKKASVVIKRNGVSSRKNVILNPQPPKFGISFINGEVSVADSDTHMQTGCELLFENTSLVASIAESDSFYQVWLYIKNIGKKTIIAPYNVMLQDGASTMLRMMTPQELIYAMYGNLNNVYIPPPPPTASIPTSYNVSSTSLTTGGITRRDSTVTPSNSGVNNLQHNLYNLGVAIGMRRAAKTMARKKNDEVWLNNNYLRRTEIPPGAAYKGALFFAKSSNNPQAITLTTYPDDKLSGTCHFKSRQGETKSKKRSK